MIEKYFIYFFFTEEHRVNVPYVTVFRMFSPGVEEDPGKIKLHYLTCQESIGNILCGWNPNKNQL